MNKDFLKKLGLEQEAIDEIIKQNGKDIENAKEVTKERIEIEKDKEIIKLNKKIKTLEENKNENKDESIRQEYDLLKNEFEKYKDEIQQKEKNNIKSEQLRKKLIENNADPDFIELLENQFDKNKLEINENNELINYDESLTSVKNKWSKLFITKEEGFQPSTPPITGNDKNSNYIARLEEARKNNNVKDAVNIKIEASKEGIFLI